MTKATTECKLLQVMVIPSIS